MRKPARYTGGEIGSVRKDRDSVSVRVCLAFPDVYEIGMSHLGLRILYNLINKNPSYCAERVFSPGLDMEELLKKNNVQLFSLESQSPVRSFDILGFSLQYELSYTNVLSVLSLSGIPLRSSERGEEWPLVIAGGVCSLNPEPIVPFIDLFVIGEAEEVMSEILKIYSACKKKKKSRKDMLELLSGLKGIYVPSEKSGRKIAKLFVRNLEKAMDFSYWVVPFIEIVHDRLTIEIMRGCPHGCRFCQAYAAFYPLRIIRKKTLVPMIRNLIRMTGYDEVSLLSLSSSDHPELADIVRELTEEFRDKAIGISLPSLRAKTVIGELSHVFSTLRKTTLTFAPEAGSQRLREMIGKDFKVDDILNTAKQAYAAGYKSLKLYFMIGLPTETEEDLSEIAVFCSALSRLKKEVDGHPARLNVTISNFIPKPHTPFQRFRFCSVKELKDKQEYIRNSLRGLKNFINLKFHDPEMSLLEAVLARGGRECADAVELAFKAGARFDAWTEYFNPALWQEAFNSCGLPLEKILGAKNNAEDLPWAFIETGIPAGKVVFSTDEGPEGPKNVDVPGVMC